MNQYPKVFLQLEELPKRWSSIRIKFCLQNGRDGSRIGPFGSSLTLSEMVKEGYKVYGQENIIANDFSAGERFISQEKFNEMKSYSIYPGDILITMMGTVGQCKIVPNKIQPGIIDSHLLRLKVKSDWVNPYYFEWVLGESDISKKQAEILSKGSIMSGLNSSIVRDILIPLPPCDVQKAIASFLDCKTAAIDTLIAKKQRLIQLLEEKRTALINHAVTKGLNPNAPMKDSGIPWIGKIPKHWEVTKLKWLSPDVSVGIVITPAKYYVENGIPCLRSLNIRLGKIIEENFVYISEKSNELLSKSKIFKGDLVCVRTGQPGTTAVIDERFDGTNCIDLIIIRQCLKAVSEYLCLLMNSEVCRSQYLMGSSGAIQQHFNVETATNLIVCNPPLYEQLQIVEYCQRLIDKYHGSLIAKVSEQIEKLQEYRQSLITAAVTGKIALTQEEAA